MVLAPSAVWIFVQAVVFIGPTIADERVSLSFRTAALNVAMNALTWPTGAIDWSEGVKAIRFQKRQSHAELATLAAGLVLNRIV